MQAATSNAKFREIMQSRGSVIELMNPIDANAFILQQYTTFRALVDKLGMRIEG